MFEHINWVGVLVATVASFIIGGLWYSPLLFARPWQRALGLSDEQLRSGKVGGIFLTAFIAMAIAAIGFSMLLGESTNWKEGLHWGLIIGLLFVAPMLAVHNAFERRPFHYWLINAGYSSLSFVIYGLILGLWPE